MPKRCRNGLTRFQNNAGELAAISFVPLPCLIRVAATAAVCVVLLLSLGSVGVVALRAEGSSQLARSDFAAIQFTLTQSLLSATISTILAIPLARALARRRFPGRRFLISALGAPFILPVIVAIVGLVAVFGQSGLISRLLAPAGLGPLQLFGLHGVVLAHVFFNMPLATRFFLQGWASIPAERFRSAAALSMPDKAVFRYIDWPMIRETAPGAFVVIFLVCLTSFAVALTLGGGPKATTVELAIYQAFAFEFDLGRAAKLAGIQFLLASIAGLVALTFVRSAELGTGLDRIATRFDGRSPLSRLLDVTAISTAAAFLFTPLVMVFLRGVPGLAELSDTVIWAGLRSFCVAMGSVAIMLVLALPMALIVARGRMSSLIEAVSFLMLSASSLVIGTGVFIALFPFANPTDVALPVTATVNAAASLPFALRVLVPSITAAEQDFARLSSTLAIPAWSLIRRVTLPRSRKALGLACGLTAALSMGDLGVIALFALSDAPTLPLMLYRLMGAYRMDEAAAAAVLLVMASFALFLIFDRLGGGRNA